MGSSFFCILHNFIYIFFLNQVIMRLILTQQKRNYLKSLFFRNSVILEFFNLYIFLIKYHIRSRMNLGEEVLHKIEDLLIQMDKPKAIKKRKTKSPTYSRRQQQIQQTPNRLYDQYLQKRKRENHREKEKVYNQMSELQHFKVQNKKSIFLNSQRPYQPLHERTPEIIKHRQMEIERKKYQILREKERKELLEQFQIEEYQKQQRTPTKVSKKQLQQIMNKMADRQTERVLKEKSRKMEGLKERLRNNREKPEVSEQSQKIWNKRKMERSLSSNVLQRFEIYAEQSKKKKQKLLLVDKQKRTPFKPKISEKTKRMNSKSPSLYDPLNRSVSCKCFSKSIRTSAYVDMSQGGLFSTPRVREKSRDS